MQSALQNDEIETEILRASSTSEFSHSLDPKATSGSTRAQSHFRQQYCPSCDFGAWSFNRPILEVGKGRDARPGHDS